MGLPNACSWLIRLISESGSKLSEGEKPSEAKSRPRPKKLAEDENFGPGPKAEKKA